MGYPGIRRLVYAENGVGGRCHKNQDSTEMLIPGFGGGKRSGGRETVVFNPLINNVVSNKNLSSLKKGAKELKKVFNVCQIERGINEGDKNVKKLAIPLSASLMVLIPQGGE